MKTFLEFLERVDNSLLSLLKPYVSRGEVTPDEARMLRQHIMQGRITNPDALSSTLSKVAATRNTNWDDAQQPMQSYPRASRAARTVGYGWGIPHGSGRVVRSITGTG